MTTPEVQTMPTDRAMLQGVPRLHFYEGGPTCPEDICLPSVMHYLTEYLGDEQLGCKHCARRSAGCKVDCTYAFFMGVSGAGSYLSWKKGWFEDNQAIFYMSDDPGAPERNCFKAAGYSFEWLLKQDGQDNQAVFSRGILSSIARGMPVIGYGIIGPPEPALITGYDEGGEVIIGWNFFQNDPSLSAGLEFEPEGQFRKRDWLKDTECLLVVGEKQAKPPLKETFREAMEWAIKVARTPQVRPEADAPEIYFERANGLAAYDAWAGQLLRDEDFPPGDEAVLRQRHAVHDHLVGALAEWRWYGSLFWIEVTETEDLHYDMAEDLLHAAACYAAEHALMWKVWDLAGGIGNPDGWRAFADPAVRRQMVPVILEARDQDAQAIDHIERALSFYK